MIGISEISKRLKVFCETSNKITKFKIYIRLNFSLEVYVVTQNEMSYSKNDFLQEFADFIDEDFRKSIGDLDLWKINVFVQQERDLIEDPLLSDLFDDEVNNIEQGPRLRFNSLLGKKNSNVKIKREIPVVTFYSYKGGMGRTTTMISYAIDLVLNKGKRVCIIDCDLEAPGYLNFFNLSQHVGLGSGKKNGLVEFLSDIQFSKDVNNVNLNDYVINVAFGNEAKVTDGLENIYIVPAGNLNEDFDSQTNNNRHQYLEGLSRINLSNEQSISHSLQVLFNKIKDEIAPDVILIDSRTGFNDIIGTASLYLADLIVGFFGYNEQTIPGLLNILDSYYENDFKLIMVSSILPRDKAGSLLENEVNVINKYIDNKYGYGSDSTNAKDIPELLPLRREPLLEIIGSSSMEDNEYAALVKNGRIEDYSRIFNAINSCIFQQLREQGVEISANMASIQLRNIILKRLKETLSSIKSFAEATEVQENLFFYRKCMNDLFDEKKFLICGYKGTGKTYLYKALADSNHSNISTKILEKANCQRANKGLPLIDLDNKLKFVNILSFEEDGDKLFDFKYLNFSQIDAPEFYFNSFWQIHTWMSILLDPEFETIKNESALKEYVKPIRGAEAVKRFDELISMGIDAIISIEEDFSRLNHYLIEHKTKLFLLYDQLDTRINPIYWGKAVSPLISYWRENWSIYSNMLPKIFIRTDLYRRVEGTNTARLEENIINIEWSIEEVFAYFFKLVFSNEESSKAFWAISEKTRLHIQHRKNVQKELQNNDNQFISMERAQIGPLVDIFFGGKVIISKPGKDGKNQMVNLGNSWDFFWTTLANADNKSISLRPFINMLDGNAVELALSKTEKHILQIISPEIYASREVQLRTATSYFDDLTQDDFSKDLICVRDFINSDKGIAYRYKSLPEETFNLLIKFIYNDNIDRFNSVRSEDDLKSLLYANGIVAEKVKRGGKVYQFASMYAYSWALKSTEYDREIDKLREGAKMKGIYGGARKSVNSYGHFYRVKNFTSQVYDGQSVEFTIHVDEKNPNFMLAADVHGV